MKNLTISSLALFAIASLGLSSQPAHAATITGTNFTATGNAIQLTSTTNAANVYEIDDLPSTNSGKTLTFTVPANVPPGKYNLRVGAFNSNWSAPTVVTVLATLDTSGMSCSITPGFNGAGALSDSNLPDQGTPMTYFLSGSPVGGTAPYVIKLNNVPSRDVGATKNTCDSGKPISSSDYTAAFGAVPGTCAAPTSASVSVASADGQMATVSCSYMPPPPVILPPATTTPPEIPNPVPPTPISASLSFTLLSSVTDHAGAWGNFGPGAGNLNNSHDDWNWSATLALPAGKTAKSIAVDAINGNSHWSTSNSSYYPLVVLENGSQLDSSYGATIPLSAGIHTLALYGQKESTIFPGFTLTVIFTDGSSMSAVIPAPVVAPVVAPAAPAFIGGGASPSGSPTPTPSSSPSSSPSPSPSPTGSPVGMANPAGIPSVFSWFSNLTAAVADALGSFWK